MTDLATLDNLLTLLRAAGEETRLRLLALCAQADLTVSDFTRILGQSQPRISRHLKILCDCGLLSRLREGSWVFFRLERRGLAATMARHILSSLPTDDALLQRDKTHLTAVQTERAKAAKAYFRDNAPHWDAMRSLSIDEAEVEGALFALLRDQTGELQPLSMLLDVGTGTGRMLTVLGPYAHSAIGIDQSHEMLALARTALDRQDLRHCFVRQGDMYALPMDDKIADLVVFHQVLHYAESPSLAIIEAARVLTPGGRLVIVDFAPHDLEYLRDQHNHRRLGFAHEEIEDWCLRAGLSPCNVVHLPGHPLTVTLWLTERPC